MDPNSNQEDQDQKKQSGGGLSQGINTINNLVSGGFKNPLRGAGSKTGAQAAKMAAQTAGKAVLSNPYVLAALGVVILIVIVFMIVASGAAPGAPTMNANPPTDQVEVSTATPTPPAAL